MGRWTALSDLDYEDEQNREHNRWRGRPVPRCRSCGALMTVVYFGGDEARPAFCRCDACDPPPRPRGPHDQQ